MNLQCFTGLSQNQNLTTEVPNLERNKVDQPIDQPGISPVAYVCNYCGYTFWVKGAYCSSQGKAMNCWNYKNRNK